MKINRKQISLFIRSAILTAVVLFCSAAVFLGICKSYEEIRRISFGEERAAVFIGREYIRILDFIIEY